MISSKRKVTFILETVTINELEYISDKLKKSKDLVLKEALEYYMEINDIKLAEQRLKKPNYIDAKNFFKELEV